MKDTRRSIGTPIFSVLSAEKLTELKKVVRQRQSERRGNPFRCTKRTCRGCRDSVCNRWV